MSRLLAAAAAISLSLLACASSPPPPRNSDSDAGSSPDEDPAPDAAAPRPDLAATKNDASVPTSLADMSAVDSSPPDDQPPGSGPKVDRADPKVNAFAFKASAADPAATRLLGNEQAFLDTRTAPRGTLVVHLHGSGEKVDCGYAEHGRLLASFGFHVFMPCYDAAVSWSNSACGGDVGNCRLDII
jgi:hypothetical protein